MSIEQSIDNLAGAILALAHALGNNKVPQAQEVQAPEGKPAATRPAATKAAKTETATVSPSEGKSASTTAADTPPTAEADAAQDSKEISYEEDIKPLFLKLVSAKGRDEARAFIDRYQKGAAKLSDAITPKQYAKVVAELEALLA